MQRNLPLEEIINGLFVQAYDYDVIYQIIIRDGNYFYKTGSGYEEQFDPNECFWVETQKTIRLNRDRKLDQLID